MFCSKKGGIGLKKWAEMTPRDKAVGILGARKLRELEAEGLAVVEQSEIERLRKIEIALSEWAHKQFSGVIEGHEMDQ